jgi:hypothetical protein
MGHPCVLVADYAETRGELVGLLDDVAAIKTARTWRRVRLDCESAEHRVLLG